MNNGVICCDDTVNLISETVETMLKFLKQYSFLIDSFILDFFVEDLWSKLPKSWQIALDDIDLNFLSEFISTEGDLNHQSVLPLSLLSFRASAVHLRHVSRKAITSPDWINKFLNQTRRINVQKEKKNSPSTRFVNGEWWGIEKELSKSGGQHEGVDHILRRKVKPKKQHEIVRLSQVVKIICDNVDCKHVIDIGSGCGHLSRMLSIDGNFSVTSLEAETAHVNLAKTLEHRASLALQKKSHNLIDITHIEKYLSANVDETTFSEIIANHGKNDDEKFCLVGLHTCGDLAPTIIRCFSACSRTSAMVSVGCCYMKLDKCYPMSDKVKRMNNSDLSYYAREAACHALEKYSEELTGDATQFKIHCYRATLESLITKYEPKMKHARLKKIKNAFRMPFKEYAEMALKNVDVQIPDVEFNQDHVTTCLAQWKRVVIFYSLRFFLAVLVEMVILFDRMIYLHEQGIDSLLIALFHPEISPRNHVLLALK